MFIDFHKAAFIQACFGVKPFGKFYISYTRHRYITNSLKVAIMIDGERHVYDIERFPFKLVLNERVTLNYEKYLRRPNVERIFCRALDLIVGDEWSAAYYSNTHLLR